MIISKLKALISHKEQITGERVGYRAVAQATGMSTTTITKVANGTFANIGKSTLDRLCAYFDCAVGDLLEYVPDPDESDVQQDQFP